MAKQCKDCEFLILDPQLSVGVMNAKCIKHNLEMQFHDLYTYETMQCKDEYTWAEKLIKNMMTA